MTSVEAWKTRKLRYGETGSKNPELTRMRMGEYWHDYPIGREIDVLRIEELRAKGYNVLVLWEREIHAIEPNDLEPILEKYNGGNK